MSGVPEPPIYTTPKGKPMDQKIDWFLELFQKTQDAERMSYLAGVPLQPTAAQVESIEWLNFWRGRFMHFGSDGISLLVDSLLGHLLNGLDIVETLLTRTQYASDEVWGEPINTMTSHEEATRARKLIEEIRTELAEVHNRYGLPASGAD